MDSLKDLECVRGGTVYETEMNLFLYRCKFLIKIYHKPILRFYELVFEDMEDFQIQPIMMRPRVLLKLSDITYTQEKNHHFTLILSDDAHKINIHCKNWQLNLIEEYDER